MHEGPGAYDVYRRGGGRMLFDMHRCCWWLRVRKRTEYSVLILLLPFFGVGNSKKKGGVASVVEKARFTFSSVLSVERQRQQNGVLTKYLMIAHLMTQTPYSVSLKRLNHQQLVVMVESWVTSDASVCHLRFVGTESLRLCNQRKARLVTFHSK